MRARFVAKVSGHSARIGAAQDLGELDIALSCRRCRRTRCARFDLRGVLRRGSDLRLVGVGIGTEAKLSGLSVAGASTVRCIAIGAPPRSACRTQLRSRLAFTPRAKATAAIETPFCWHAPTASAWNSSLWCRRRRRPRITSLMNACTPPRLAKMHPYISEGR